MLEEKELWTSKTNIEKSSIAGELFIYRRSEKPVIDLDDDAALGL